MFMYVIQSMPSYMSCKACHHAKQPDNIGEVDTPLLGQDPQVREDTLYLHKAAEGVSL